MHDVCFASFGDASFASAKQLTAQQGLFIMACTSALVKNETTEFSPIVWHSKQIGRVVRSTLSAEAYAMSSSLEVDMDPNDVGLHKEPTICLVETRDCTQA